MSPDAAPVRLRALRADAMAEPLAVGSRRPRLTWVVEADAAGASQRAFRVRGPGFDSGRVESDAPAWTPPSDLPVSPGELVEWRVEVEVGIEATDAGSGVDGAIDGDVVSARSVFGVGPLDEADWAGSAWIGGDPAQQPATAAPLIRQAFELPGAPVRRAVLHLAAGGYVDAELGGVPVSDERLGPGFAEYDLRVPYASHDVTDLLRPGRNVLGLHLGRGFFGLRTPSVWNWHLAPFHAEPCVRALLVVELDDGRAVRVGSDGTARTLRGPVLADSLYAGETADARRRLPGWSTPELDDAAWAPAALVPGPSGRLAPRAHPPIRVQRELAPVAVRPLGDGRTEVDFGDTIAGWCRVSVTGQAGETVTVRLDERGVDDDPANPPTTVFVPGEFQTDRVVLSGGHDVWEPRFGYAGFRYATVTGLGEGTITARHVHSDVDRTARFSSSEPLFDWMHEAAVLTMRNNLHHIPTDTPMWEKNGWTGDAALGADMLIRDLDTEALLVSWLRALDESADAEGRPALIVPASRAWHWDDAVAAPPWNTSIVVIPWRLYEATGDPRVLADHWPSMLAYLRLEHAATDGGIARSGLGDYLAPGAHGNPDEDLAVSGTAYLHEATRIAVSIARLLGDEPAAAELAALLPGVRAGFLREYYDPDARVVRDGVAGYRQTHSVLALEFGLLPDGHAHDVAANLAADIDGRCDGHLDVGALGVRRLLQVLGAHGRRDTAWRVATQTTYPSWGLWRESGATTMWEMWDDRRSRDHYFLGTVDDWLFSEVAGIRPLAPGHRAVEFAPQFTDRLDGASAEIETVRGRLAIDWQRRGDDVLVDLTLPVGSSGVVALPGGEARPVTSGRHRLTLKDPVIPNEGPRA